LEILAGLTGAKLIERIAGADLVCSTFPFASQVIGLLKSQRRLSAVAVTFVTDPAPHPTWLHHGIDCHLTVDDVSAALTKNAGFPSAVGGPLVRPVFRERFPSEVKRALRRSLGIEDGRIMALVTTGSHGIGPVRKMLPALASDDIIAVVLCGRNRRLQRAISWRGAIALGWRNDVPLLMCSSDVLVHNAGGLSLTEARVVGLPAVTYMPIAGHGRLNAQVLHNHGIAPCAESPNALLGYLRSSRRLQRTPIPIESERAADIILDLIG
jgi:UDP-N-acetylglucosamine:LPS N-acetylglucosamine transferase